MITKLMKKTGWYLRLLLAYLGVKRSYEINHYSIQLDYSHLLPDYQKEHPFYDRFLPHLVSYLPEGSLAIDVGANIGDTLVGMLGSNDKLEYLCVEASEEFFPYLKRNVASLMAQNGQLRISILNEFVGKDITNVRLDGRGGTKYAVVGGGTIKSKPMVSILSDLEVNHRQVSLLKTDVDGFDWDVIRSSFEILSHTPYVYFECHYDKMDQLQQYKRLFTEMISIGYSKFAFFDNFGQFLLSTDNISEVGNLLDYVARQNFHNSTRTNYYYDVLAYSEEKSGQVDEIIREYNGRQGGL